MPFVRPGGAEVEDRDALRSLIAWLSASRIWRGSCLFLCSACKKPVSPSRPELSSAVARSRGQSRRTRAARQGSALMSASTAATMFAQPGVTCMQMVDLRTGSWFFSRSAKAAATWRSKLATLCPDRGLPGLGPHRRGARSPSLVPAGHRRRAGLTVGAPISEAVGSDGVAAIIGLVRPDAMHDDGEFSCERDLGAFAPKTIRAL